VKRILEGNWIREAISGHGKNTRREPGATDGRNQRLLEMPRKKAHGAHGKDLATNFTHFRVNS